MKKTTVFIIITILLLSIYSCGGEEETEQTVPTVVTAAYDDGAVDEETLWICNRFGCVGTAHFELPKNAYLDDSENAYFCENYKKTDFYKYVNSLKNDGFDAVTTKYDDAFLCKSDCIVFLNYYEDDKKLCIKWYEESPFARDDLMTAEDAKKLLCPEESLSKIKLMPLDITPKGFSERTGGQIFAVPEYSYDLFNNSGQSELIFADNEYYNCSVVYVKDGVAYSLDYNCIAVTDIDLDGFEDVCILKYGFTSGLFTFGINVISNGTPYYRYFYSDFYDLSFVNINKRVYVGVVTQENEHHVFKMIFDGDDGERYINLYENSEPLSTYPKK